MSADPRIDQLATLLEDADRTVTLVDYWFATEGGGWCRPDWKRIAEVAIGFVESERSGAHSYLSTGCYHGRHDYCAAMTGMQGEKRPARCKWCEARCDCRCHSCPTCSGPVRETVGMICQTCGTDYSTPASGDGEPDARPGYVELRAFWDYWHKQCGHFDVPGEGHGLVTGIDAKDAWELDRLGDAVEAALARPATPAVAGAPDVTDSAIYQQARQGGAGHVEAMRLAADPDADWPIH